MKYHVHNKLLNLLFCVRINKVYIFGVYTCCMQNNRKNWQKKLGIFLMVFSGVFFALTLIIPMLGLPAKTTIIAATTSYILMQVIFWTGGLLVGKELFVRYKKRLNPVNWFRR